MGRHDVTPDLAPQQFRAFTRALLTDVRALDHMIREGMFETEIRRMGAEQEVFLVNRGWRPASVATQVLEQLEQKELTTELALFNLEMNLDPLVLESF
jgi:hypothetical protein